MSKLLSSISGGGGGSFIAEFFESVEIPLGQSADYVISCPSDRRLKISSMVSSSADQLNIGIMLGSRTIVDDLTLVSSGGALIGPGKFAIGDNSTISNLDYISGLINEDVTISFGTTTTSGILLSYQGGS